MKTITIIKDILGIAFIVWVLSTPVNDWWTVFGILIIAGDYNSFKGEK